MTRTAAITGAYGYHGSLVRSRLDQRGWNTIALVADPRPGDLAERWSPGASPPPSVLASTDALVHCAYDTQPLTRKAIWQVNVDGTERLLTAAADHIERILVISSMSAYPGTKQLYGQAKLEIERIALSVGGIAVRPGLEYGGRNVGAAGLLLQLTRLPIVPVFGGAAQQFPVHEDDLADALCDVLDAPGWVSEVIGVAQPRPLSFRELMRALAAREGNTCRFVEVPWRPVYWALRIAEAAGLRLPMRADSLLGLVRPATSVPRSAAFPTLLDTVRPLNGSMHSMEGTVTYVPGK